MTEEQKRAEVVRYRWERAHTSLNAARREAAAGDYPLAIIRPGLIEAEWADVLAREQVAGFSLMRVCTCCRSRKLVHGSSKMRGYLSSVFKNTSSASE